MTSTSSLFSVPNKVAVITGSSRGLGLNMAESLLLGGCSRVYISSRKSDACQSAVEHLTQFAKQHSLRGKAYSIPADVSSLAGAQDLRRGFEKVNKENGLENKCDILIANAGATWAQPIETFPNDAFNKVMNLNVAGVFYTVQVFLDLLREAGTDEDPARVVVTGSVAGLTGLVPNGYSYNASKAGVHQLAKHLAAELGPEKITVNVIAPGFFPSKMTNGFLGEGGIKDAMIESNPMKRLGLKEDIYGVTLYLVSKAGAYVNGIVLPVDGGSHIAAKL